ncbi:rhomboid family intramembrane serine protease [Cytobacillus sp. IB215316]|uniref:rhomboid family intramembrane serine protease n=1 Tax=Cytobacillus sp. IB215316 TaxID=3097354 RepID=UPI002A0B5DCE|nr:rhomboid family intramembrane serine protease [Cytobacillus sp. IB215316]MDX8362830.1 rhomboid family intramembrane serine protease [Cytobacillus sp. IB215316]
MFMRTENFRTFLFLYPIISIIIAIHILFWLILAIPTSMSNIIFQQMVGLNFLISQGEYWRLFTPIIIHSGFGHMLLNSFSLVLFGPALEKMLGKWKFIVVYIGAGFIANMATYFIEPLQYAHVGSSGAIFGLFGVYLYIVQFRKDIIDHANSQVIITILVIGLIMTFINPNINVVAHLFGLIGGAILAPLLITKNTSSYTYVAAQGRPVNYSNIFTKNNLIWLIIIFLVILGLFAR